jgi:hypothetical protein
MLHSHTHKLLPVFTIIRCCAHCLRSSQQTTPHHLQYKVGRRTQDIQYLKEKKRVVRGGGIQLGIIIIPISASSSSQSIALLIQASCPACSDPIPTRSVSETQFKSQHGQRDEEKRSANERAQKGMPYVSVTVFTDELVLEICVRRQVHRCAPHRIIGRIQRYLYRASLHQ